jgi:hypothetical protein
MGDSTRIFGGVKRRDPSSPSELAEVATSYFGLVDTER